MSDKLTIPLNVILDRLASVASQDKELITVLRRAAEEFLRLTEPPIAIALPAIPIIAEETATEPIIISDDVFLPAVTPPQHVSLPSVPGIEIPTAWLRRMVAQENNLQLIEVRCRLKAEGARWAATRQRSIRDGASYYMEIEPRDRDIINKAKTLDDCFLWMNHPTAPIPTDLQVWEDVAGCFEAVAMAVSLLRQVIEKGDAYRGFLEKAIDLAAESQSALRMAVTMVDEKADNDQYSLFNWLRQMATEQQVYVQRYMRLDDPANPTQWNELQERISQLDAEIDEIRQRDKQRTDLFKKGQYHARLIRDGKGASHDWTKVIESVDTLVSHGIPPSSTDLRDMLVPIVDELPEANELPDGFQRALREVDRHLATQSPPAPHFLREVSVEVRKAASLYKGKTMVIIGGDRRPNAYEALKSAFGLKELIWIATRDHESNDLFVPYISRPDVDVVLLAIRWSSHSYGDLKGICDKYGKEFVRLPAGYNPNQVAHQILQQKGGIANAKND